MLILIYWIQCLKIVSKLTSLVLSSTNLSGPLCIQDLDTAQKMGLFWLVETDCQDVSNLLMCAFQEPAWNLEN